MDPRRRQLMIRILEEMENKKKLASKIGIEDVSHFKDNLKNRKAQDE